MRALTSQEQLLLNIVRHGLLNGNGYSATEVRRLHTLGEMNEIKALLRDGHNLISVVEKLIEGE